MHVFDGSLARDEGEPLHAVLHPLCLGYLDEADLARGPAVRAPARLDVPAAYVHHPHHPARDHSTLVEPEAVLLLGDLPGHEGVLHPQVLPDHLVRHVFDLLDLCVREVGEMGDVYPAVILLLEGRVLPDPGAEHLP